MSWRTTGRSGSEGTTSVTRYSRQPAARSSAFQWSKDGTPLTAARSAVYAVEAAETSHAGLYTCTATNSGDSATRAEIPVGVHLKPPVIVEQPSDIRINEGQAYKRDA
jgi:hypothetical protein